MKSLQTFASVHASIHNHFALERHFVDRQTYRERRAAALAEWQIVRGRGARSAGASGVVWIAVRVRLAAPSGRLPEPPQLSLL